MASFVVHNIVQHGYDHTPADQHNRLKAILQLGQCFYLDNSQGTQYLITPLDEPVQIP